MRTRLLLLGVVALATVAILLWLRPRPGAGPDPSGAVASSSMSSKAVAPLSPSSSAAASVESAADTPAPRESVGGRIEILVKSERGPIAGARVRVHVRGPRDPNRAQHLARPGVSACIGSEDEGREQVRGPPILGDVTQRSQRTCIASPGRFLLVRTFAARACSPARFACYDARWSSAPPSTGRRRDPSISRVRTRASPRRTSSC